MNFPSDFLGIFLSRPGAPNLPIALCSRKVNPGASPGLPLTLKVMGVKVEKTIKGTKGGVRK